MKIWRRFLASLLALSLLCCFGTTVFAYETVDTEREVSLTVYFGKDGNGFSGVEFRVYRVAEMSAGAQFILAGDFADYPVKVNGLDSSGCRALAQTLDGYAARDDLAPLRTVETGNDGKAVFNRLDTGLYLVTGDRYRQGRYTYTPEPFLIALPTLNEADAWVYDVTASCKYDSDYNPPGGGGDKDTIDRKVLKVWQDDGNEEKRPDEIIVQLLRDGDVYDTVTLSERNNWKHTWNDLDEDHVWRVVEYDTPEGYTVTVDRQGITFVMTNSQTEEIPDEPPPTGPGLPQTGMLWWPVPVLACAGLFLFLIGWGKRHHAER